ncbi:MAG TPA: hypothetical protein VFV38_39840 [Ktedonobacteraceae bacterium]|nr:hypothetical protein [Ktedonobacteraceae bacterium]
MTSSWKWRTLALFASLLTLVLYIFVFFLIHVDQYTNMSAAQVGAQER